jgi:hypothetical protein|eukprot:COSAG06_NODE_609_length_13852_cov_54.015269_7_plen_77_part_00
MCVCVCGVNVCAADGSGKSLPVSPPSSDTGNSTPTLLPPLSSPGSVNDPAAIAAAGGGGGGQPPPKSPRAGSKLLV